MSGATPSPGTFHEVAPAPLAPGETYELRYCVLASDSPRALGLEAGDVFPDVLATARMVALMELAAARLMRPLLGPGELSVGVKVDVEHTAATPLYCEVVARAIYLGGAGKLHRFSVELLDGGGVAGKGLHERAIVRTDRLLEKAQRRVGAA
jgi:fluoroacetyl-CoA thioesterase